MVTLRVYIASMAYVAARGSTEWRRHIRVKGYVGASDKGARILPSNLELGPEADGFRTQYLPLLRTQYVAGAVRVRSRTYYVTLLKF